MTAPGITACEKQPSSRVKPSISRGFFRPIATVAIMLILVFGMAFAKELRAFVHDDSIIPTPSAFQTSRRLGAFARQQLHDDPAEVECVNIDKQADPCEFIKTTESCNSDAIIPYLKIRYCLLPKSKLLGNLLALVIFAFALLVLLSVLGQTADVWLVPSLTQVSHELKLSPTVAGLTLLSAANGAPDIITGFTAVSTGAPNHSLGLVLGSLSGAAMCIGCLILGLSIIVAKDGNTYISRGSFYRSMTGYILCIGCAIVMSWTGKLTWWNGLICMGLYCFYLIVSVIYLQTQERKKAKAAREVRRQTFIRSTSSFRLSLSRTQSELEEDLLANSGSSTTGGGDSSIYAPPSQLIAGGEGQQRFGSRPNQSVNTLLAIPDTMKIAGEPDPSSLDALQFGQSSPATPLEQMAVEAVPGTTIVDDEDEEQDQTTWLEGLMWNDEWDERSPKNILSIFLFTVCFPFAVLRWLSIPASDIRPDYLRGLKRIFLHISPLHFSFILGVKLNGLEFAGHGASWVRCILVGVVLTAAFNLYYFLVVRHKVNEYNQLRVKVQLDVDAKKDQDFLTPEELAEVAQLVIKYNLDKSAEFAKPAAMTLYLIGVAALSFISSICWLSIVANEVVEILQTIGQMFGISATFLGLTVLAMGNSVPDAFGDTALARQGRIATAYSAIWSAPILSNAFGFGTSILVVSLKSVPVITYETTLQIKMCWVAVLGSMALVTGGYIFYERKPPRFFGIVLASYYGLFIFAAIVLEIAA